MQALTLIGCIAPATRMEVQRSSSAIDKRLKDLVALAVRARRCCGCSLLTLACASAIA